MIVKVLRDNKVRRSEEDENFIPWGYYLVIADSMSMLLVGKDNFYGVSSREFMKSFCEGEIRVVNQAADFP